MLVAVTTFIGWFVLSNHCALGRMAPRAEAETHGCCHNGMSQPAKAPADSGRSIECCKSLHAVVPDGGGLADLAPPLLAGASVVWMLIPALELETALVPFGDTGPPPRVASFSELVLHRSLRSHAPPFLA